MRPVALMRRGIAPPTSAMNSRRFIANPSPDAFNHNEFFVTGPSRRTSEMGQSRRFDDVRVMSAVPLIATE
jgi:hypothetical protein